MKNRKFKRNVFIFVLVLCLSTAILPCLAAGETIDIEGLEEYDHTAVVEFIDSYGCYCVTNQRYGKYVSLGEWDLSKYKSLTITYGADNRAVFYDEEKGNAYIALTTTGAVQDTDGNAIADANIIGQVDIPVPGFSWSNDELEITIDSNYSGEVYLAIFHIVEGHDCLISDITLWEKESAATATPVPTEKTSDATEPSDITAAPSADATAAATKEPETTKAPAATKDANADNTDGDSNTAIIITTVAVILVVAAIVVFLIIKKKK